MKRILVIDDDEQLRPMLLRMLQYAGYHVVAAANGTEGIRLNRGEPADLVITDIFMPEKEGLETIRELHKEFPELKIIAISGGSNQTQDFSALPYARKLGATATLAKPFRRGELLKLVRDVLGDQE
jgi:CheY-like chemotaxis protein